MKIFNTKPTIDTEYSGKYMYHVGALSSFCDDKPNLTELYVKDCTFSGNRDLDCAILRCDLATYDKLSLTRIHKILAGMRKMVSRFGTVGTLELDGRNVKITTRQRTHDDSEFFMAYRADL